MKRAQPIAAHRRVVCSCRGCVRTFTIERNDRVDRWVELVDALEICIEQLSAGEALSSKLVFQLTRRCCGEGLGNHGLSPWAWHSRLKPVCPEIAILAQLPGHPDEPGRRSRRSFLT